MSSVTDPATGNEWFPTTSNDQPGWRLDIVSLLAVIGESSMAEHSQPMTASWVGCLPRIIPAPQVLLKPTRPTRMPQVNAIVVGVESGVFFSTLNYFANILVPIEDLPPYAFLHLRIEHTRDRQVERAKPKTNVPEKIRRLSRSGPEHSDGQDKSKEQPTPIAIDTDVENPRYRMKKRTTMQSLRANLTNLDDKLPPHVPAKLLSPLNILSIFSCLLTLGLFAEAGTQEDGVAMLALAVIALSSMIVGYASLWSPVLMKVNNDTSKLPPGDVVIRTREGAFIVVKCTEEVARELYSGTEECRYSVKSARVYRALVGIGTFLVMVSVVLLGNCNFTQQATIGGSYILLNGLYWAASLIPKKRFWDLSLYHPTTLEDSDDLDSDGSKDDVAVQNRPKDAPNYTQTLWRAIRATKSVGWVKKSGGVPNTAEWDEWLRKAETEITAGNFNWDAVTAKNSIVGQSDQNDASSPVADAIIDGIKVPGGQQAPDVQMQVPPQANK